MTFDADLQHRPQDVQVLLAALIKTKADFALGSRFLGEAINIGVTRKLLLKLAVVFTRVMTGLKLTDAHNIPRNISALVIRRTATCESGPRLLFEFFSSSTAATIPGSGGRWNRIASKVTCPYRQPHRGSGGRARSGRTTSWNAAWSRKPRAHRR